MLIKIAVDIQIGKIASDELERVGYTIVYKARASEPDIEWVHNAVNNGATILISPDLDIPDLLDKNNINAAWIGLPQGIGGLDQAEYIKQKIARLIKNQSTVQAHYKIIDYGNVQYLVAVNNMDKFLSTETDSGRLKYCKWRIKGNTMTEGGL